MARSSGLVARGEEIVLLLRSALALFAFCALLLNEPVLACACGCHAPTWQEEADARIDRLRKTNLYLQVTDANGSPIPDATFRLTQQRHAFRFGTAVSVGFFISDDPEDVAFRSKLLDLGFNAITIENGLKWRSLAGELHPVDNMENSLTTIQWAQANGLEVRGHNLVWPGKAHLPDAIDDLIDDTRAGKPGARETLEQAVLDHVTEVATATAGGVVSWDVVNEIGTNRDLLDIFGESVMDDWFAAARAVDPDAKLFINEFDVVTADNESKRAAYLRQVKRLVGRGAEIDGIGFQSHFGPDGLIDIQPGGDDPQTLWDVLDEYHRETGLEIAITEYDLDTTDEQLKADYLREFLTAAFAHPAVNEFTMWGFWESSHWRPDAAMIKADGSETLMSQAWRDLVLDAWWSEQTGATDENGFINGRFFKGDYLVEVEVDGQTHQFDLTLGDDPFYSLQLSIGVGGGADALVPEPATLGQLCLLIVGLSLRRGRAA